MGTAPATAVRWETRLAPVVAWAVPRSYRPFRRPPTSAAPSVPIAHGSAVFDGLHNLTTDMVWWRGRYLLVHSASRWHMASGASRIVVWASADAHGWHRLAEARMPDGDIRDPERAASIARLSLADLAQVPAGRVA